MQALSVRQPWAWLIVHGQKDVENRTWPTNHRGPVLIHAAKQMAGREDQEVAAEIARILKIQVPKEFKRGGIIGQVEIVDCVTESDSDWFEGPYGFVLRNPKVLQFRPCPGQLGFFNVPDADSQRIESAWGSVPNLRPARR